MAVYLPIDIESNILSRLPVKSLIRFKSVQKSWNSLISSPDFVKIHHQQSHNNNLLIKHNNGELIDNIDGDIVIYDDCRNSRSIFNNDDYSFFVYDVVGSVNGLICVYGVTFPYLYNPSRECIILLNPSLRINKMIHCGEHNFVECYGFCYHYQTKDYKLITRRFKGVGVDIYSLNSDSWSNIECAWGNYRALRQFGVFVSRAPSIPNFNGAFYWVAYVYGKDHNRESKIISFDMEDKVFKEMTLPPSVPTTFFDSCFLTLWLFCYKDLLALFEGFKKPMDDIQDFSRVCYVWVMKELDEPKSWTKLCTFDVQYPYVSVSCVGIILETELVLMLEKFGGKDKKVNVFDIEKSQTVTKSNKDINIFDDAEYITSFTESLVLLDR